MAYYAASSPPPPKAPSLAPTTNSELTTPPPPPPVEEKKKKSFAKKILKELAGGGGNNVKVKGVPVVRPYGRGGVGVKPNNGPKSQASLSTTSSKSPPSSVHQSQPAAQISSPPPPPTHLLHHQSPVDEDPRYLTHDYYAGPTGGGDYDDNQSTLSSIPAPRRTQQWIQQHAHASSQLPSPPHSSTGAPSMYGNPGRDPYPMSPAPSQYMGSQYSRGSDGDTYYQQQQYPGGYAPSSQTRRGAGGRLPDVNEDGDFDAQFGRMHLSSPQSRAQYTASPATSISTRRTPTVFSSSTNRTPATPGRYNDRTQYGSPGIPPPPQQAPPLDSATALVVEQYLARQGIAVPPGMLDQYRAAGAASHTPAPPQGSEQTRELQSQIDALREAERKARERLEALRKDDGLRSASAAPTVTRKESDLTGRLDVMGHPGSGEAPTSSRTGRRPGTGDSAPSEPRQLTTQERAIMEKEKLRQRDLEREREMREREALLAAHASSAGGLYGQQPALDPLTALLQAAQPQQNPLLQQQNLLLQALAAQQLQQAAAAGGSMPPNPATGLGYGDMGQQNLIMQLGALLLQQQQQLQMLAAGRAAAASPVPSDPTMSPPAPPALDLNALLLGAALPNPQAGLAALLQQQQQGQQSPVATYPLPVLTTTAPSNSGHGNTTGSVSSVSLDPPPSPTTVSSTHNSISNAGRSNSSTSAPTTTTNSGSRFSPNPTPSPKPSSKLEREFESASGSSPPLIPPATAPLRLGGSFMREFNREMGLSPTTPTGGSDDSLGNGSVGNGGRMIPPRAGPPRVPLPDVPAGRLRREESPASAGTGPGTPPPAYMSAR